MPGESLRLESEERKGGCAQEWGEQMRNGQMCLVMRGSEQLQRG